MIGEGGEEEGKGKAVLEMGDPDRDEDPEEGPYTDIGGRGG